MSNDPIVASVRQTREELARQFDYDVHAIFADLRERESQLKDRLVPQPRASAQNRVHDTRSENADASVGRSIPAPAES